MKDKDAKIDDIFKFSEKYSDIPKTYDEEFYEDMHTEAELFEDALTYAFEAEGVTVEINSPVKILEEGEVVASLDPLNDVIMSVNEQMGSSPLKGFMYAVGRNQEGDFVYGKIKRDEEEFSSDFRGTTTETFTEGMYVYGYDHDPDEEFDRFYGLVIPTESDNCDEGKIDIVPLSNSELYLQRTDPDEKGKMIGGWKDGSFEKADP